MFGDMKGHITVRSEIERTLDEYVEALGALNVKTNLE
jgi:hypothetical protein